MKVKFSSEENPLSISTKRNFKALRTPVSILSRRSSFFVTSLLRLSGRVLMSPYSKGFFY
jgi:hypothetical protein